MATELTRVSEDGARMHGEGDEQPERSKQSDAKRMCSKRKRREQAKKSETVQKTKDSEKGQMVTGREWPVSEHGE